MMNIALHSSDYFAPILGVSMTSILENNQNMDKITIYVIEHKITEEHKQKLKGLVESYSNGQLIFIPMPDINKDFKLGLKKIKSIWLFDSYCRLFLGSILPNNVERVLYLDCDTLCHGPLKEFYNTDLNGCCCAGVADCLSEKYYELFGMDGCSHYCNSGVILFDLKVWRADKMEDMVARYVREKNGYVFFMEQSVMNIVLQNRIKIMHPKYNTYTLMVIFTYENLYRLRLSNRFYTKEEIREAITNPVIIHLTNNFYVKGRAWIEGNQHPYNKLFMYYRSITPWKDEPLFSDKTSWLRLILNKVIRLLPQSFVCGCVGWVYNQWRPAHIERIAMRSGKNS